MNRNLIINLICKNFAKKIKNLSNRRFDKYQYTPEQFNPNLSRYALNSKHELKFSDLNDDRNKIPKYLSNDGKSVKEKQKYLVSGKKLRPGKRMVLPKLFPSSKKPLEDSKNKKTIKEANTQLVPLSNNIEIKNNNTSIARYDENYIMKEKSKRRTEIIHMKKLRKNERTRTFNTENLLDFQKEERLSKRMSRLGICSRRQADNLIRLGMIKVKFNLFIGGWHRCGK